MGKRLTVAQILAWADAHHQRRGRWPTQHSGPVTGASGQTWKRLDAALRSGSRGLPGGDSLARLLARERGARNRASAPALTVRKVLAWADAHCRRTGRWPTACSGPVLGAAGETWGGIDQALTRGLRGLPGGDSLARLLNRHRREGRGRWTTGEDGLVRALPPKEAAERTRRSLPAVYQRRYLLGVARPHQ
jgi:hypothetical protein